MIASVLRVRVRELLSLLFVACLSFVCFGFVFIFVFVVVVVVVVAVAGQYTFYFYRWGCYRFFESKTFLFVAAMGSGKVMLGLIR